FVATLAETAPLLERDFDVVRRQKIDLVGYPLHLAPEAVAEAAGEVDDATGEVAVHALQVEDHRHVDLELVGDVLGVVERRGPDHEGLGAGAGRHRPDDPGTTASRAIAIGRAARRAVL